MTVRSILVSLDGTEATVATLETAFQVAKRLSVHADVLHVRPDSHAEVPAFGDGMTGEMHDRIAHGADLAAESRALRARHVFSQECARFGIKETAEGAAESGATASLIEKIGHRHDWMMRLGRVHDLVVVGHPSDKKDLQHSMTIDALFKTGRPVLVVPKEAPKSLGEHIAIAWNGSPECARAVGGATNFFPFAKKATILTAQSDRTPASVVGDLAAYLAHHGLKAETKIFAKLGKEHLGGRRLLAAVAECGADLLVMGAHTTGAIKQLVLGNATREVLEEAPVPVLMGH